MEDFTQAEACCSDHGTRGKNHSPGSLQTKTSFEKLLMEGKTRPRGLIAHGDMNPLWPSAAASQGMLELYVWVSYRPPCGNVVESYMSYFLKAWSHQWSEHTTHSRVWKDVK